MPSAASPACASSTRRPSRAQLPGARRVPVRVDDPDRADPARIALGIFSERSREPFRRSRPLSHGSRASASAPSAHMPGFLDRYYYGRRPTGIYIPRYANVTEDGRGEFVRGFGIPGHRANAAAGIARVDEAGVGAELKQRLREPGPWEMVLFGFARDAAARGQSRHAARDSARISWGIPLVHIDCTHGENELKLADRAKPRRRATCWSPRASRTCAPVPRTSRRRAVASTKWAPRAWAAIRRPRCSTRHNQAHDVPNLFITDGSCMTSSGCVNPSLTYMALSARAANSRRRPARVGRALVLLYGRLQRAALASRGPSPRPHTHHELAISGGRSSRSRGSASASAKPHAGGPGRGFRDHRNASAIEGAAIYLIGQSPVPTPSLLRPATRTPRAPKGHAGRELADAPRLSLPPSWGLNPDGPFACFGRVFWA